MLPAVRMALSEAAALVAAGVTHLKFEHENAPGSVPAFDIDLGVVAPDGSFTLAYQFKSCQGLENLARNANSAAKQLVDAPAKDKWVVLEVVAGRKTAGTKAEYDASPYTRGIADFKANYPGIRLRIEFADNQTLTL